MSVKLRFRRMGRRKLPVFGLVATDSRSPRDGRFIEDLGRYEPVAEPSVVTLDAERIVYWLSQGAQPSDTVRNLLQKEGVLYRWALTRQGKEADEIEQAVAEFKERQGEKAPAKKTRAERRAEALEAERKVAKERAAEIEKERQEREAELRKQREEAEAAERAAAEEARAEAAAAAADSEAMTEATNAPEAEASGEAAETASAGEPVENTSSQAEATGSEAATTAAETAAAEAADGDAAVAEAGAADVPESGPTSAEDQPATQTDSVEAATEAVQEQNAEETQAGADLGVAAPAADVQEAEGAPETAEADDLTTIHGVGPTYAEILTGAGMTTYAAVAEASVEQLQAAITDAGSSTAGNEETWPEQARLLAAGDTAGHDAYVETLKNA